MTAGKANIPIFAQCYQLHNFGATDCLVWAWLISAAKKRQENNLTMTTLALNMELPCTKKKVWNVALDADRDSLEGPPLATTVSLIITS